LPPLFFTWFFQVQIRETEESPWVRFEHPENDGESIVEIRKLLETARRELKLGYDLCRIIRFSQHEVR
jgi:hypothetical protein